MFCKLRRLDLLRSGQMSDCELHVWHMKDSKRCCRQFRCHSIILASASEEFERMINDPKFKSNKNVMQVDDASPEAYEALLLYAYTYEIYNAISIDMCAELIHLATKYKMSEFIDSYLEKLADKDWPIGTVLKIFQVASEHNKPDLMKLLGEKIIPIATQVITDKSFLTLSIKQLKALMTILKSEANVPEEQLLEALKAYQVRHNIRLGNMACFQQFVDVTNLFGEMLFEIDGTLAVDGKKKTEPQETEAILQEQPESTEETPEKESVPEVDDSAIEEDLLVSQEEAAPSESEPQQEESLPEAQEAAPQPKKSAPQSEESTPQRRPSQRSDSRSPGRRRS